MRLVVLLTALGLTLPGLALPAGLWAQQQPPDSVPARDPVTPLGPLASPETPFATNQEMPLVADSVLQSGADEVSPLGAFLRAIALPTWGHSVIGSHRRGAFYAVAEAGTAWMLFRTVSRRSSARAVLSARETVVRQEVTLANPGVPADTLDLLVDAALDEDPRVVEAQGLVDARQGQFEDWVAMGIFLTFLSGADAFVSAHLRDFPDPIDVQVNPTPDGGVQVGARIRVGGYRPRRPRR